jgi:hypothetical protein
MIRLIYVSSATYDMSREDLNSLLKQSREKNKKLDITGILLYAGGNFFQVIEGEESVVNDLYNTILKDNRNRDNILIYKKEIESRIFPDWAMGFKYLTAKDRPIIDGYTEFLERRVEPVEFLSRPDAVVNLLYQFKKGAKQIDSGALVTAEGM